MLFRSVGANTARDPLRYGPTSTQALYDRLIEVGADPKHLEAKVFGGASIVANTAWKAGSLGNENAACALRILTALRIPVVASDLGGNRARKVIYRIENGSAWIKSIRGTAT